MPDSHARQAPSLLAIERPRCSRCHAGRMVLTGIRPLPNHSDLRTFQCTNCEHVHKVEAEDPLTSAGSRGWINSGLNPPK